MGLSTSGWPAGVWSCSGWTSWAWTKWTGPFWAGMRPLRWRSGRTVDAVRSSVEEETDTVEEVYEPYLLQLGLLTHAPGPGGDPRRLAAPRAGGSAGGAGRGRTPSPACSETAGAAMHRLPAGLHEGECIERPLIMSESGQTYRKSLSLHLSRPRLPPAYPHWRWTHPIIGCRRRPSPGGPSGLRRRPPPGRQPAPWDGSVEHRTVRRPARSARARATWWWSTRRGLSRPGCASSRATGGKRPKCCCSNRSPTATCLAPGKPWSGRAGAWRPGRSWPSHPGGEGAVEGRGAAGRRSAAASVSFAEPAEVLATRAGVSLLPPYIHEPLADPERYQTVYANRPGSVAAPTAGLHLTVHGGAGGLSPCEARRDPPRLRPRRRPRHVPAPGRHPGSRTT